MGGKNKTLSWFSFASIFAAALISIPSLIVGDMLIYAISFKQLLLVSFIGFVLVALMIGLLSIPAISRGIGVGDMVIHCFGSKGGQLALVLFVGGGLLSWFVMQLQLSADSLILIVQWMLGEYVDEPWLIVALGLLITLTAVLGIQGLKLLSFVVVPVMLTVLLYVVRFVFVGDELDGSVFALSLQTPKLTLIASVTYVVGSVAILVAISMDYSKYVGSNRSAFVGAFVGLVPVGVFLVAVGALLSMAFDSNDLAYILSILNAPFLAILALGLVVWTIGSMSVYSAGQAYVKALNLSERKRPLVTFLVGSIGILLALLGWFNRFESVVYYLVVCLFPVIGVFLSDLFFVKSYKNQTYNYIGIVSWLAGCIALLMIESWIKLVMGSLLSAVLYVCISRLTTKGGQQQQLELDFRMFKGI